MPRPKRELPWLDLRDSVYYVFEYDPSSRRTRRTSLHTSDPEQARALYAAYLIEAPIARANPAAGNGLTCGAALDDYEREHISQHASDPERFKYLKKNLMAHFGKVAVKDIDIPLCRAYAEQRRQGLVGRRAINSTIRRELGALNAALAHEVKWKRLQRNDLPVIELTDKGQPKERWLTRDELRKLREAASGRTLDFIDLAYYTASRKTAIVTLTKFQVDLPQNRIRLAKPGEKKTKKRRPVVPIDPAVRTVVERLMKDETNKTTWLLGEPANIRKSFETAVRNAGLEPPTPWVGEVEKNGKLVPVKLREPTPAELEEHRRASVTPHTLRHSRITHLLQDGVDPWAVAGLAGDTLDTIMEVYGHHCPDHLGAAVAAKSKDQSA